MFTAVAAGKTIAPMTFRALVEAPAMPPHTSRRGRRLWWLVPPVVVLLLAGATLVLFALSSTQERGDARQKLVTETLWTRESIRFQLDRELEALQLIANDVVRESLPPPAIEARLEVYMRRARQIMALALVDGAMAAAVKVEREGAPGASLELIPPALAESAMGKARQSGKPVYAAPFAAPWGGALALFVPLRSAGGETRFLLALHSLERLLEEMVPWTFAQEHEVSVSDPVGSLRATRAAAGRGRGIYTHQEPLELPGLTLILGANSVLGPPNWIGNALRGGIAALAAILLLSLWALWRDVQRRVAAEARLREESQFRRAMGDSALVGLRARDLEGRVTYVNPAFCRMVGFDERELVGREWDKPMPYWVPELRAAYERRIAEVFAGKASTAPFETMLQRRGGERFPVAIYDSALRDASGAQVGWMSSIVDLTEDKRAEERERLQEERLHNAARLTTMGEMASSLAHELNQPLGAISSYLAGSLNLLERGSVDPAELRQALRKAAAQAERAGHVIRRVHEFVRKQEPKRGAVAVEALLLDCQPLVELQARREGARVEMRIEERLPAVHGDPVMLQQVILNLTRNAVEAMGPVAPDRRRLVISAARGNAGVRLSVRDYGTGIPDAIAEDVFSPFFTTKSEGMGMGLSICRSIVEAHGGRLWFERRADGVDFHVQLPDAP